MSRRLDPTTPVRLLLVGAGAMGGAWMRAIHADGDAELAGIVDLDATAARSLADAAEALSGGEVRSGTDLLALARDAGADAIVDVTIPAAHYTVTRQALEAGYPVLGEKPAAATLAEAVGLADISAATGELFMVSQSRRYSTTFSQLRELVGGLGPVGLVTQTFARAPHFGGFREQMAQPLLVDMAIHHLDAARAVIPGDPVSVWCESFNPSWSWFDGDASAVATFSFADGARLVYSGSWCSPGHETSWNASWRVSAASGTAVWDGETAPTAELADGSVASAPEVAEVPREIAGSLAEFIDALRTGATPQGEVHDNLLSLAMVEAAVRSADTGAVVGIPALLDEARAAAPSPTSP